MTTNKGNILVGAAGVGNDDIVSLRHIVDTLNLQRATIRSRVGRQNYDDKLQTEKTKKRQSVFRSRALQNVIANTIL